MKLTNSDVQTFALAEFNTFDLNNLNLNEDVALKELRDEIIREWNELNSSEVMKSRHDYFQIPMTKTSDYSEVLLDLGDGKKVIYGIRHMGGNRDVPFIKIKPNFTINDSKEILEIYKELQDELKVFKPQYLSFWSSKKIDVDFIGSTYLVSKYQDIKAMEPWEGESSIELKMVVNDSYYDWYKSGYEKFHREYPDLKKKVTLNSIDSMKESKEQGLLYEAYTEGVKIGLISGERVSLLGHPGI